MPMSAVNQRIPEINGAEEDIRPNFRQRLLASHIRFVNDDDVLLDLLQAAHQLITPEQPQREHHGKTREEGAADAACVTFGR